jgi:hypothetical protein
LHSSPRVVKLGRLGWTGNAAFHGSGEKLTVSLFGKWTGGYLRDSSISRWAA